MMKRMRDWYWWLWIHWPRPFRFVHRFMAREERRVEAEEIGRFLLEREALRERPWEEGTEL